tara:strand:+ start:43868 stop:44662 length:795 start_codon:yes stop_codon:yes gene_type:complete
MSQPTILNTIVQRKAEELAQDQAQMSLANLMTLAMHADAPRGFISAIQAKLDTQQPAVIAQINRGSPSKGILREHIDVAELAQDYEQAGAACLSIITDRDFFLCEREYLPQARTACGLPLLCKEFIIDPYQVYQARSWQADAILLIAATLEDNQMRKLHDCAVELGMDVLIEVHDAKELERVLTLETTLIGINNRNLHNFETSIETTIDLLPMIPDDKIIVSESGIHTVDDVKRLRDHNINTFLVGESFMRAEQPGEKLKELFM